jgi:hypothetical protein
LFELGPPRLIPQIVSGTSEHCNCHVHCFPQTIVYNTISDFENIVGCCVMLAEGSGEHRSYETNSLVLPKAIGTNSMLETRSCTTLEHDVEFDFSYRHLFLVQTVRGIVVRKLRMSSLPESNEDPTSLAKGLGGLKIGGLDATCRSVCVVVLSILCGACNTCCEVRVF